MVRRLVFLTALLSKFAFASGYFGGAAAGASIGGNVTDGTSGSVLFVNPSATLNQNNSKFFWDNTNFRLGIGNGAPSVALDVTGALKISGAVTLSNYSTAGLLHNAVTTGAVTSSLLVNADVDAAAAIAYSKLALTGSILNADVNASAAIAYSKLALTGAILNADINASAAIAYSKLALTGSILNADVNASAAIAYSKLASMSTGQVLLGNAGTPTATSLSGDVTVGATGVTAIGTNKVANSQAAQMAAHTIKGNNTGSTANALDLTVAQALADISPLTTKGDTVVYSSGATTRLGVGNDGQVIYADSAQTPGIKWAYPQVLSKSTTYTTTALDRTVILSSAGGAWTLSLIAAASSTGICYDLIKNETSTNAITVDPNSSETIFGLTTVKMEGNDSMRICSDGTNWQGNPYKQCTMRITGNGTSAPTITENTEGCISSTSRTSAGNYTVNFVTGAFSATPTCDATVDRNLAATRYNISTWLTASSSSAISLSVGIFDSQAASISALPINDDSSSIHIRCRGLR